MGGRPERAASRGCGQKHRETPPLQEQHGVRNDTRNHGAMLWSRSPSSGGVPFLDLPFHVCVRLLSSVMTCARGDHLTRDLQHMTVETLQCLAQENVPQSYCQSDCEFKQTRTSGRSDSESRKSSRVSPRLLQMFIVFKFRQRYHSLLHPCRSVLPM